MRTRISRGGPGSQGTAIFSTLAYLFIRRIPSLLSQMQVNLKRYGLYLLRWQLSTPILAGVGIILVAMGQVVSAVIANLIGGLIFFWVDRFIFTSDALDAQWEVKDAVVCVDCGRVSRGYRLVKTKNYDRSRDREPEFRCEECSIAKSRRLKEQGFDH